MPQPNFTRWFALHVRSRHEKSVQTHLDTKNKEVFLPLYSERKKWADRMKTVSLPLFPGYVFCRFDPGDRHSVLVTPGVIDVLRVGPEPAPIADSEIEALQLIDSSRVSVEPYPSMVKGQSVVITDGPLKGLLGTIANVRNELRLVVNVELLCRSVLVEIDRDWALPSQHPKSPYSEGPGKRVECA